MRAAYRACDQLRHDASYRRMHGRATQRAWWAEWRHQHTLAKSGAHVAEQQGETANLRSEIDMLQAKVRDLRQRLLAAQTQHVRVINPGVVVQAALPARRPRGQQLSRRGHGAFIGWNDAQRRANLQRVVNNARLLILSWVKRKGLASKLLAMAARRPPPDWQHSYGYRPLPLDIVVQTNRHRGTCRRAANWTHVGQTVGRGKEALTHEQALPIEDVWLYPRRRDDTEHLRA